MTILKQAITFFCILIGGISIGQEAEEIMVSKIKTNYKVYHEGQMLFEAECAQCHGINERLVSVKLSDVHHKRSREWLLDFLIKPETLEYSDDKETLAYLDEYGAINHTVIQHMNEADYNKILDFVASEENGPLYDEDKIKEEYYVLEGKDIKVGDYKKFHPSGQLAHYYMYNNGLPWKVVEVYDVFGDKRDGGTLNNGTGTIIAYDQYGNKEKVTSYRNGFRSGEYKQYYDGGQIELLGYYTNGKANGQWTYFYTSGEVKNYINYKDGRIVSNREGDKLDVHPGIKSQNSYGTISKPVSKTTTKTEKATIIYPYNATIRWTKEEINNPIYTDLGSDLISHVLLKKQDELYINATTGFKKFHPPLVLEQYVKELESYGEFEFYRLDNVGFTDVKGQQLVLMEYYLSYKYQKIKMYVTYLRSNGQYKLDGWSFETAN